MNCNIKEKVIAFIKREWTMEEKILLLADVLLAGVLLGWLTSPFKGGFFSNNRISSTNVIPQVDDELEMTEE